MNALHQAVTFSSLGKSDTTYPHDAALLNAVGMHHYLSARYERSRDLFKAAADINPNDVDFCRNYILGLKFSNQGEEALEIFAANEKFHDQPEFRVLEPDILTYLGRHSEAITHYEELFQTSFRIDDDLLTYLNLLTYQNDYEKALNTISAYLEKHRTENPRLLRWQHQVTAQSGDLSLIHI